MLQLKHMYQFNCSLSHPLTLQNSWGTSQSKDACVSFGSHLPLGPFIPHKASVASKDRLTLHSKLGGRKRHKPTL